MGQWTGVKDDQGTQNREGAHCAIIESSVLGRGNSMCKGPKAEEGNHRGGWNIRC